MQPSDAWLLVVIKYAERDERPADLPNIFATGDWINRTIFLDSELAGGFSRLEAGGLIKIDGKGCAVTDKFHQVWTAAKAERRSAPHDQVVALRKYFGISN